MADTTGLLDSATVAGYQKAIQGQTASQIAQEASSLGLSASQVAQVLGITAADVTAAGYTPTGGKVNADVANNTYVSPGKFQAASTASTPAAASASTPATSTATSTAPSSAASSTPSSTSNPSSSSTPSSNVASSPSLTTQLSTAWNGGKNPDVSTINALLSSNHVDPAALKVLFPTISTGDIELLSNSGVKFGTVTPIASTVSGSTTSSSTNSTSPSTSSTPSSSSTPGTTPTQTTTLTPATTPTQTSTDALQKQLDLLQKNYDALVAKSKGASFSAATPLQPTGNSVVDNSIATPAQPSASPVYGPDGTMFPSSTAARAAGVYNYTNVRPTSNSSNSSNSASTTVSPTIGLSTIAAPGLIQNALNSAGSVGTTGSYFTNPATVSLPPGVHA